MINTLLVFDENDNTLGSFFSLCKEELESYFFRTNIDIDIIDKRSIFDIVLDIKIASFNKENFVFAVFSHGDSENLLQDGTTPFISTSSDLSKYMDSFFFSFACETGKILGEKLVEYGCKCFIGYKEKTYVWTTYMNPFVKTATYGLIQFYKGKNMSDIFNDMKNIYDEEIDKLYKTDFVIASILMDNRDGLVMYGDETIDINFFKINDKS
ncbi:MAG: hypothetical protein GY936_03715 [Ignavibacteriae bacterium]|nr:hypothetical protein [Ignavibacteriota bacterium]